MSAGPYDAFLLVSFGGPEGMQDVLPFLRNVTRGRGVPEQRLAEVAEHYRHFGGVSPINAQCRALLDAIGKDFAVAGLDLPLYWGNRNWRPYLAETVASMRDAGVRRALAFVTSAYGSYSSCRQYLEDIERARAEVGAGAPVIDKLRHYHDHPGHIQPHADALRRALASLPGGGLAADGREQTRVVFTAHSIPVAMASAAGALSQLAASAAGSASAASERGVGGRYQAQLREVAGLVAARAGWDGAWDLVWQSRSGPPQVPWLEPDITDHLRALREQGIAGVAVAPIGFISDHLEVIWDLDTEAAQAAGELGMDFVRAATPGTDPRFVAMVRELVVERLSPGTPRAALGALPTWDACAVGCCTTARPGAVTSG
ncbi:MAG: ferrochelatase [Micromonosporaceae bacterium]|nr:ferrochelatase [Micromonosporaceae bacterium]